MKSFKKVLVIASLAFLLGVVITPLNDDDGAVNLTSTTTTSTSMLPSH